MHQSKFDLISRYKLNQMGFQSRKNISLVLIKRYKIRQKNVTQGLVFFFVRDGQKVPTKEVGRSYLALIFQIYAVSAYEINYLFHSRSRRNDTGRFVVKNL